ncbi:MAG: alpha/beta hydrolase, partial [Rhodococcus sp.]|nr:alpha/beta hydrolase [Rhodococcus sp. (in: high G+C Gram-positive bacteria)]
MVAGAYVIDEGAGLPVMLCGGLGGNWFDWTGTAAALVERGCRVLSIERPGYGLGPAPTTDPDLRAEVNRMRSVLDALGVGERVVAVGHSLGAIYAEGFARLYPHRTRALVLLDATVTMRPWRWVPTHLRVALAHRVGKSVGGTPVQSALAPAARAVLNQSEPPGGYSDEQARDIRRTFRDPLYLETSLVENASYPLLARQLAQLRGVEPLTAHTVVAAADTGRRTPWSAVWLRRQRTFARFLRAEFEVVTPARHHLMIDQP